MVYLQINTDGVRYAWFVFDGLPFQHCKPTCKSLMFPDKLASMYYNGTPIAIYIYIREVKTFSTKTSRDVGMVPSISKEHMCLHGKTTGGKTSGTRRGTIPCSTTQVDILWHQRGVLVAWKQE